MTIKEYFDAHTKKSKLQYSTFAEYNFWLFQYTSRRFRVEVMKGDEFAEKSGRIRTKHVTDNWNRIREILASFFTDTEGANKVIAEWMERGNYIKNEWVRRNHSINHIKFCIRLLISCYDAYYSCDNNLFYLPLSIIEQWRIEKYASLTVDMQAEAKFLSDLSHTYGDYFYNYADWFPMNDLLTFFIGNSLEWLKKERNILLGKTADDGETSIFIGGGGKSPYLLEWIDRRIQTLQHDGTELKDGFDGSGFFYERHLSRFIEKGYAWHPLLDQNSGPNLYLTAPSTEDLLPLFFIPPVLQSRNDNLSEDKENISQNLIVDRCPFPRGYRTKDEVELLRTKYSYNDLLVCIWIKPDRDKWSDGETMAKKICRIINKEIKNKNQSVERKEKKIILNEAEMCMVAKNISDWDICTNPDLIFIIKINDKKYNKSLTDKSIQYLCKMHFTMYFKQPFHPSDGADIFYQAHSHAPKSFKEMQICRFLGLWAWDQIELNGKPVLDTVRKAIEIRKKIFKSWEHVDKESPERQMKTYLEGTRLCVKAGKVLPLT